MNDTLFFLPLAILVGGIILKTVYDAMLRDGIAATLFGLFVVATVVMSFIGVVRITGRWYPHGRESFDARTSWDGHTAQDVLARLKALKE